jgi:hypothetical protein
MSGIQELTFVCLANTKQRQKIGNYRYVFIEDATGDFQIGFGSTSLIKAHKSKGFALDDMSNELEIKSTTAQTVTVQVSMNPILTGRSNVTATVNTTIEPSNTINNDGDVIAGATATLAIAANANRKEVEICLPSTATNPVRIGNSSVNATSGSILEPGCSKVFGTEAALYVVRTVTDETVTVLEMERP